MSNLQKILAGRKKESSVWKYFEVVNTASDKPKSRCIVTVGENGKQCGVLIAGTNATNLKKHVDSNHKEAAEDVDSCNTARKKQKTGNYII